MDFYALLFYPRVLTEDEKGKLFTYINEVYQSPKEAITAESIGLGNVDNTADLDKPLSIAAIIESDTKLDSSNFNKNNIGLGAVDNTADIDKPISTAAQAESDTKLDITAYTPATAESIGLGDVDNTTDIDKPISTVTQTALNTKLDTDIFDINTLLPGIPVTDVAMAFVPSFKTTVLDDEDKVVSLRDYVTGRYLIQPDNALAPVLNIDSHHRPYLRFDNSHLFANSIDISSIGGTYGNSCTFILIANIDDTQESKTAFDWANSDRTQVFTAYLQTLGDDYYVYYGVTGSTGRVSSTSGARANGKITSFLYERSASFGQLFVDGVSTAVQGGLTATIPTDLGTFILGTNGNAITYTTNMDFYALLFYPRSLSMMKKIKCLPIYVRHTNLLKL